MLSNNSSVQNFLQNIDEEMIKVEKKEQIEPNPNKEILKFKKNLINDTWRSHAMGSDTNIESYDINSEMRIF